jgi:membrane protease YdiL (CAAX protease family)
LDYNSDDNNNNFKPAGSFIRTLPPFAYVIIVLGIIFFLYQVIGAALAVAAAGIDFEKNIPIARIVLSFGEFMFILAPTIFFTRLQTADLKGTFRLNIPNPLLVMLAILGIILIQPILQGYMSIQTYILNHIPFIQGILKQLEDIFNLVEETTMKLVKSYSPFEFSIVVFVIAITPAICEEMLFRGFVLKNLEKVAKANIAIFLTGFLFALYHLQPFNLVPLIILGTFLSFVVYYSNSIYVGMLCHFLNNFFAAYFVYVFGKEDIETPRLSQSETIDAIIFGISSLVLFVFVMYLFYKFRYKMEIQNE